MANKKISQLTAKGSALAATDLVEISEDAGGGNYLTKSVTGANIKSGLQDTLVSGTNIKTINSNSILGSGNLVIGSGVHVLTKPISGRTYNARTTCAGGGFVGPLVGSSIQLYPFIPANSLTVSSLQVNISTLTIGGLLRILVYSDSNGVPSSLLSESTSLICSVTGPQTYTPPTPFTFTAGTVYWLGYYANINLNNMSVFSPAELTPISSPTASFSNAHRIVTAVATFGSAPATLGTATPAASDAIYINLISA